MAKLLYFGRLVDITRSSAETQNLPETVQDTRLLREWVTARYKADNTFLEPSIRIAINNELVNEPCQVNNDDEIAFMPPVGGG